MNKLHYQHVKLDWQSGNEGQKYSCYGNAIIRASITNTSQYSVIIMTEDLRKMLTQRSHDKGTKVNGKGIEL